MPAALRRLRQPWDFAIYRASHDDYEDSLLPTGSMGRNAEDALDTACGLYLADPTPGPNPPTNLQRCPLAGVFVSVFVSVHARMPRFTSVQDG